MEKRYKSFREFYPFYLSQHQNPLCRFLHWLGCCIALLCLYQWAFSRDLRWLGLGLINAYMFAWVGHFYFEKNRPASFKYPLYSLMGDWVMFCQITVGFFTGKKFKNPHV